MAIDGQMLLSAAGGAAGAFVANFVNVDFKRWRDGGSLAAALAGELRAHESEWASMERVATEVGSLGKLGFTFRAPTRQERRQDRMYEASVPQLGLLGPAIVTQVIRAYSGAADCRERYALFEESLAQLAPAKVVEACDRVVSAIANARNSAKHAGESLEQRSKRGFFAWYLGGHTT